MDKQKVQHGVHTKNKDSVGSGEKNADSNGRVVTVAAVVTAGTGRRRNDAMRREDPVNDRGTGCGRRNILHRRIRGSQF